MTSNADRTFVLLLFILALACPALHAQEELVDSLEFLPMADRTTASGLDDEGPTYVVHCFEVRYEPRRDGMPSIEEIMTLPMVLGQADGRYTTLRNNASKLEFMMSDLPKLGAKRFHFTAVRSINQQIVAFLNDEGFIGVVVQPDPADIGAGGMDLRENESDPLTLVVRTGVVKSMRTVASGSRFDAEDEKVNNPAHQRILDRSPVRPAGPGVEPGEDLIRKDLLDRYLYRLSRHPGRRVDVALSASDDPEGVSLDYLVGENKPWMAYFQGSNTGTENTNEWRWRLGFVHNQLFNRDDILSVEYVTTDFTSRESRAALASYEAPLFSSDSLRWSVYGLGGQYQASDVGRAGEGFEGQTGKAGGELYATVFQYKKFFADVLGGGRYEHLTTNNETVEVKGNTDLFFPYVGCRYERHGEATNLQGRVSLEWTRAGYTDTNEEELTKMGRLDPSQDWFTLRWDMTQATFLEPILNRQEWEDTATPESSTMAHELFFSFRGQSTFDRRVIPQHQMVVGGAYSVRGYPEAVAVGDSAAVGTLEYRFHLPRSFGVEPDPSRTPLLGSSFRFAPQQVYGRPDWDLVLRAFFDAGWTFVADPLVFEEDETLYGTGLGLEFTFKNNLSLRADYGLALSDVRKNTPQEVESGNNELHLTFTVLF